MRGRKGVYISRWSFGSETSRNWNWVDVHICRRPVPAIDIEQRHWFYFIFGPCAANLSPSSLLVPTYRSNARLRLSLLNETVLCDSINSAKRKTSGREEEGVRLIRLVASGYGRRDHFAGIFSSCIIELINTCYNDTRNRSTSAGIADTTRIVRDAITYHIGDSITQRTARIRYHRPSVRYKWNRCVERSSSITFHEIFYYIRDIEFLQQYIHFFPLQKYRNTSNFWKISDWKPRKSLFSRQIKLKCS